MKELVVSVRQRSPMKGATWTLLTIVEKEASSIEEASTLAFNKARQDEAQWIYGVFVTVKDISLGVVAYQNKGASVRTFTLDEMVEGAC